VSIHKLLIGGNGCYLRTPAIQSGTERLISTT
jgi:hypothetical protein